MRKRFFKNISGFSAIEGLVAGAVVSLVALGVATTHQNSSKANQGSRALTSILAYDAKLRQVLYNSAMCSTSLTGTKLNKVPPTEISIADSTGTKRGYKGYSETDFVVTSFAVTAQSALANGVDFTATVTLTVDNAGTNNTLGARTRNFNYTTTLKTDGAWNITGCSAIPDSSAYTSTFFKMQCLDIFTKADSNLCTDLNSSIWTGAYWYDCESKRDASKHTVTKVIGASIKALTCDYS